MEGRRPAKYLIAALLALAVAAVQMPLSAFAQLSFTTQANWRILNVPYHRQVHGLSCEAAALQMALGYQGINVSQDQILSAMVIDWRGAYWDSAGNFHWGDPYDNFVGNPDGAEFNYTGYGTYYPTVVRAANKYGGSVIQAGEGIAASTLYQALLNGSPVVAWGSFDWKFHRVSHYVAFDGDTVQFGAPYEHTVTLVGVTSDYVLVNNPWFGIQWIDKPTFEASYATFNHMAVIMGATGGSPSPSSSTTYAGATPVPTDSYRSLAPTRILDTRNGTGGAPLGPGATLDLQVTGAGGVPSAGVSSVALNVTATNQTTGGFLTVYPTGSALPTTSNLNWTPGHTVPNLVVVPVGAGGKVSFYNGYGSTDLVVDVEGWYGPSASTTRDGLYNAVTPWRLMDTRTGNGTGRVARMGAGETVNLQVAGRGGVPSNGASAVILNVTATNTTAYGYLTLYPAGGSLPVASNLNWWPAQTVPNRVVVPLGSSGMVSIYNGKGAADVIVDVGGWFTDTTTTVGGSRFVALAPQRILDTRQGFGRFAPGSTATVGMSDPASMGITAVVLNATVASPNFSSYMTVWPDNAGRPLASDLNFTADETVPNLVVVKVGTDGGVSVYNGYGSPNLVLDLDGYYGPVTIPS